MYEETGAHGTHGHGVGAGGQGSGQSWDSGPPGSQDLVLMTRAHASSYYPQALFLSPVQLGLE